MLKTLMFVSLAVALAACTEKPQTVTKKADTPAWQGAANPHVASGWKVGDEKSWEAQMRARALAGQDEYGRVRGAN